MKRYILKKSVLSIYFIIASFVFVAITFPIMEMKMFPTYFTLDLFYILAITTLAFALPLILQSIAQLIVLIVEFAILISSASLYISRGDVFTWPLLKQIRQLTTVTDMVKIPVAHLLFGIVIILGFICIVIFIKIKEKIKLKKFYNWLISFTLIFILGLCSVGNILIHNTLKNKYDEELYFSSDSYMYNTFISSYASLQKFGFWGYYIEDAFRRIFPSWAPNSKTIDNGYEYEHYSSILNGLCENSNVIMIYAESFDIYGISKELTPVLYSLKHGADLSANGIKDFYNVTSENGETKIERKDFDFDGSNYVYNSTDIFSSTKFEEVGLELSNYHADESTNVSEHKALTSFWSDYESNYTLPKLLSEYQSTYIHGFWESFYNRNLRMQSNIGFNEAFFIEDMKDFAIGSNTTVNGSINVCSLDSVTMKHYTDYTNTYNVFPTNKNFFTFFMTVTTHADYSYSEFLKDNYSLVDSVANTYNTSETFSLYHSLNSELKTSIKEYYARTLDTEYALAYVINYLHKNNILDKTIITFTGDHRAYANNLPDFKQLYSKTILKTNSLQNPHAVEAFIYSTQIKNSYLLNNNENRIITHLTECMDLIPTILTLLGREYNQDLFMGYPVINKSIISPDTTLFNKVLRSYHFGYAENELFISSDGKNLEVKDSSLNPTQDQIKQFKSSYNKVFMKFYHVKEKRTPSS